MENKKYRDCFFGNEKLYKEKMELLDKKIESYNACFMSNAKWRKLFLTIFDNLDIIEQCEIVVLNISNMDDKNIIWTNDVNLTNSKNKINNYILDDYIDTPLAGGHDPISYREIEYLEFRKHWTKVIHKKNQWSPEWVKKEQNLNKIKERISDAGKFQWEGTEEYIRIYGYK